MFRPAPAGTGFVFIRTDLDGQPRLKAHPDRLCQRLRRTAMAQDDLEIHTPEHCLAAAAGLGIDNLFIELDGVELPGLDGSARLYVECLHEAGLVDQDAARLEYTVSEPIAIANGNASLIALPWREGLRITYTLDDHRGAFRGPQMVDLELTGTSFLTEIAPARTFITLREVESARAAGLGKGATTDNTLVWDGEKLLGNTFRFPDEPARHKVLDLIGDLALTPRRVNAHLIGVRSGHVENMALVKQLHQRIQQSEKPPFVFDVRAVLAHLPHRYPLLLVDRVLDYETSRRIVAIKNVTINEPYFQGHFPGLPMMPGVLQVEAMAQAGAILLLTSPENRGKVPMFMSMDKVKFRRPVYPGDCLRIEVEALRIRRWMSACRGRVLVDGQVCAEAEIRSILVDRNSGEEVLPSV